MITVFYDGKCGLCRREIGHYQRIAPQGIFAWVDITTTPQELLKRGPSLQEGLKALHVEDDAGVMHKGAAAFAIIWQRLPRLWPLLAAFLRIPFMLPITEKLYATFAAWRIKRAGHTACDM
jgi:predicted DCC family thiol-disulfide oxidoreductase YuxK